MQFKKTDADRPLCIAFLGCGFAAEIHSKTLKKFPGVHRYYASRSVEKAATFCKKFNGHGHFGSYEAALSSPEIDVALVLTLPVNHLEWTLAAIRAGKHVIVEKPPFLRSHDFDQVRVEREKTGVQVMVAENYFYKPSLARLRQVLAEKLIGEMKFLILNATKTQKTGNWRDEVSLSGGGSLFEGGIHWINYLSNLGYDIESVQGFRPGDPELMPEPNMERSIQVVLKYAGGGVATLLYSWEINTLLKGLRISRIYGTQGSISFESNGIFLFVRGKKWRLIFPGLRDIQGYHAMFSDFFDALKNGREPAFNLDLARRDLVVIEKALVKEE